jgi:hypothetical protein
MDRPLQTCGSVGDGVKGEFGQISVQGMEQWSKRGDEQSCEKQKHREADKERNKKVVKQA